MSDREAIVRGARSVLERHFDVALAALFGSWSRGDAHARSDVDIGVSFRGDAPTLTRELALQADLERALGRSVDLVVLETAPPPLAWRIARDGVAIFEPTPGTWDRFRIATAIERDELAENVRWALAQQRRLLAEHAGP